jgi:hypothetical protein
VRIGTGKAPEFGGPVATEPKVRFSYRHREQSSARRANAVLLLDDGMTCEAAARVLFIVSVRSAACSGGGGNRRMFALLEPPSVAPEGGAMVKIRWIIPAAGRSPRSSATASTRRSG